LEGILRQTGLHKEPVAELFAKAKEQGIKDTEALEWVAAQMGGGG